MARRMFSRVRAALFSGPGSPLLEPLVRAAVELANGRADGGIAYVPAASTRHDYFAENQRAFAAVGDLRALGTGGWQRSAEDMKVLDDTSLIHIPGGNTYVLAERLQRSGLREAIRVKVLGGTPLLTFSAGTVLCGPTILSTNDWNLTGATPFEGLRLLGLHVNPHFPSHDAAPDVDREDRIEQFLVVRGQPVLGLEEEAQIQIGDGAARLQGGLAWLFEHPGSSPRRLMPGAPIPLGEAVG